MDFGANSAGRVVVVIESPVEVVGWGRVVADPEDYVESVWGEGGEGVGLEGCWWVEGCHCFLMVGEK